MPDSLLPFADISVAVSTGLLGLHMCLPAHVLETTGTALLADLGIRVYMRA